MDKPILLGGQIFRRDYSSFNFVGNERNTTYEQVSTGGACAPASRSPNIGASAPATAWSRTRSRSTRAPSTPTDGGGRWPGVRPAQGRPIFVRRNRRPLDLVGRLFDAVRQYRRHSPDPRPAVHPVAGFRRPRRRRPLSPHPRRRDQIQELRRGWVFSLHGEGGYIKPLQDAPRPFATPIRLTDRFFGPQLRGFDIRGIGPRVQRVPYNADGDAQHAIEAQITDALGGRAYYRAGSSSSFRSAPALRSLGMRPSAYIDAGSLWSITKPELTDIVSICALKTGPDRACVTHPAQAPGDPACDAGQIQYRARASRNSSSAIRPSRACRSASASTGCRRSVRCASISPRPCSSRKATTPNCSAST